MDFEGIIVRVGWMLVNYIGKNCWFNSSLDVFVCCSHCGVKSLHIMSWGSLALQPALRSPHTHFPVSVPLWTVHSSSLPSQSSAEWLCSPPANYGAILIVNLLKEVEGDYYFFFSFMGFSQQWRTSGWHCTEAAEVFLICSQALLGAWLRNYNVILLSSLGL